MGTITISIDEEAENQLRKIVEERGGKKGDMGKVVSEAMKRWVEDRKQKEVWKLRE